MEKMISGAGLPFCGLTFSDRFICKYVYRYCSHVVLNYRVLHSLWQVIICLMCFTCFYILNVQSCFFFVF